MKIAKGPPPPAGYKVRSPPVTGDPLYVTLPMTVALVGSPHPTRAAGAKQPTTASSRIARAAWTVFMTASSHQSLPRT